jgi:hypothetical protein
MRSRGIYDMLLSNNIEDINLGIGLFHQLSELEQREIKILIDDIPLEKNCSLALWWIASISTNYESGETRFLYKRLNKNIFLEMYFIE